MRAVARRGYLEIIKFISKEGRSTFCREKAGFLKGECRKGKNSKRRQNSGQSRGGEVDSELTRKLGE
jgi:hypothetical protein